MENADKIIRKRRMTCRRVARCRTEGFRPEGYNHSKWPVASKSTKVEYREHERFKHNTESCQAGSNKFMKILGDFIDDFALRILPDPMHCIYGGVLLRLLEMLSAGKYQSLFQLKPEDLVACNELIKDLSKVLERSFFSRLPRTFLDLQDYKCSEGRVFLLYISPIVFEKYLPSDIYESFKDFFVAMTIMESQALIETEGFLDLADVCMRRFCRKMDKLLGCGISTPNLHLASHLHLYAAKYGALTAQSCFSFESYNSFFRKFIKPGQHPDIQFLKRYLERVSTVGQRSKSEIELRSKYYLDCVDHKLYKPLKSDGRALTCKLFANSEDVFTSPISSKDLGIFKVKQNEFEEVRLFDENQVNSFENVVVHSVENYFYVFPLRHLYDPQY